MAHPGRNPKRSRFPTKPKRCSALISRTRSKRSSITGSASGRQKRWASLELGKCSERLSRRNRSTLRIWRTRSESTIQRSKADREAMPDAPEIPEAKDPFEKRVALTIAIIAICLSFIGNLGDNAKTDAIIKTNEASNQWGYFQAKSIKGQLAVMHSDLLSRLAIGDATESAKNEAIRLQGESERYNKE